MQCLAWFLYVLARALYEGYYWKLQDLGHKSRGIQEGQYFTVLTSRWDFKHSDTSSIWCLEYIKMPLDVGATLADSSSDYPFKQSNI